MTEVAFSSDIDVRLLRESASDIDVIEAMLVSTHGGDTLRYIEEEMVREGQTQAEAIAGKIGFLMANRHGSPFEHNYFRFFMRCPIFVYREHHRHRIGISYNEESGRYTQLSPEFYIPGPDRNLVQVGKPGAYNFEPGSIEQYALMRDHHMEACRTAYRLYEELLDAGIAKEVARMSLPVNIYSSQVVSLNARSMMAFLSLRQAPEDSWPSAPLFPSKPMKEINMVADVYEAALQEHMPLTWEAFVMNGRVAP